MSDDEYEIDQYTGPKYEEKKAGNRKYNGGTNAGKQYMVKLAADDAFDCLIVDLYDALRKRSNETISIKERVRFFATIHNNIGTGLNISSTFAIMKEMKKLYKNHPAIEEVKEHNSRIYEERTSTASASSSTYASSINRSGKCDWCGMTQDQKASFLDRKSTWNDYINLCDYCS